MVQTRVPEHVVLESVRRGDPTAALEAEATLRRQAGLPPYASARGTFWVHADDYAAVLEEAGANVGVSVSDLPDGRRLLHAPNAAVLSDLLARTERPGGQDCASKSIRAPSRPRTANFGPGGRCSRRVRNVPVTMGGCRV